MKTSKKVIKRGVSSGVGLVRGIDGKLNTFVLTGNNSSLKLKIGSIVTVDQLKNKDVLK